MSLIGWFVQGLWVYPKYPYCMLTFMHEASLVEDEKGAIRVNPQALLVCNTVDFSYILWYKLFINVSNSYFHPSLIPFSDIAILTKWLSLRMLEFPERRSCILFRRDSKLTDYTKHSMLV